MNVRARDLAVPFPPDSNAVFRLLLLPASGGGSMGVYELVVPAPLARALTLVYGTDVVEATRHHDVHHARPRIAARDLAAAHELLAR